MSLLQKADLLRTLARTNAEGAKERRDREQAALALDALEAELSSLESRAAAARAARAAGVPVGDVAALARPGMDNLAARAQDGLPNQQALQAATRKVRGNREAIESALGTAWRTWAAAELAELPVTRGALLPPIERQSFADGYESLRTLARNVPSAADVEAFTARLRRVRGLLDAVDANDALLALLARLEPAEGVRLDDLSDADIALLRAHPDVAEQIVVRRRR